MKTLVILADGEFPTHPQPLGQLLSAGKVVCCDGAAEALINHGIIPDAIVGDMDSLPEKLKAKYASIIHKDTCQETNDLTKAFRYALELKPSKIVILGASGLREDHTIGNISLLSMYSQMSDVAVEMWTNTGVFYPVGEDKTYNVAKGSQVSVFALDNHVRVKSEGLKYPLDDVIFDSWWKGTLNEADSQIIKLSFVSEGRVLLFIKY